MALQPIEYRDASPTVRAVFDDIKTNRKVERTRHDIGVGSTRAQVLAKVPGVRCFRTVCQKGESLPGERITAFFLYHRRVTSVLVGFVID